MTEADVNCQIMGLPGGIVLPAHLHSERDSDLDAVQAPQDSRTISSVGR